MTLEGWGLYVSGAGLMAVAACPTFPDFRQRICYGAMIVFWPVVVVYLGLKAMLISARRGING